MLALFILIFSIEIAGNADSTTLNESEHIYLLNTSEIAYQRSSAITALARQNKKLRLSNTALTALLQTALSDSFITIRLQATRLLTTLPMERETKDALGEAWARELTTPDRQVWRNKMHPFSSADVHVEASKILAFLYAPPYPDHVIAAWIKELRSFGANEAIELLSNAQTTAGFTAEQIAHIKVTAAQSNNPKLRAGMYSLIVASANKEQQKIHLNNFQQAKRESDRLFAASALIHTFRDEPVPLSVAKVANRVMLTTKSRKVRGLAATLVSRSVEEFSVRESRLMVVLKKNKHAAGIIEAFLEMYGDDRLQELIVRYVADSSVPETFKTIAVRTLGEQSVSGQQLPETTHSALKDAAWQTYDYHLISTIHNTLNIWHADVPWIIYVKSKNLQSYFLLALFAACVLLNLVCAMMVSYYLIVRKFAGQKSTFKKASSIIGWLIFSIVMLGLLIFAFLGFLGHNSAPSPRDTILFNAPLYLGTVIYVFSAWLIIRKMQRAA